MSPKEISRKLGEIRKELDERGVAAIYLFGSTVRGDAKESSDIDLLVDFRPGARKSLFALIGLQHLLEDHLGRKVDMVPRDSIHPALKEGILAECKHVA